MLARYKYDPFGRRIEKEVNGVVSRYVYDGPNILAEYDGDGKVKARYIHNLAVDDPLAMEQGGKTYYYHKDGLGSIVSMSDETGQTVQGYEYDSFGRILSRSGNIQNPFTYTGREYDEETGLYYYRARYYDPHPGRFLTKDPIGFAGGDLNLYRYVQNNPVNRIDPWGLYDDVGVHLIVTYQRALAKGIDPSTAWEIAWACRGVDKSLWTRPESPLALFTGQLWYNHFHPRDKWLEKRLRRSCEKQDPKEFGKNLHPLEDSFAHLEVNSGSRPYSLVAPFFHLADMNVDLYFENTYRDQKMLEALDYWLGEFSRSYYGAHPQNIPK
jgi:RHS repeat-associated protein